MQLVVQVITTLTYGSGRRARTTRLFTGFLTVAGFLPGCLAEASFPAIEKDLRLYESTVIFDCDGAPPARRWLEQVHERLADLLPAADRGALVSDELPDRPKSIYTRFGRDPDSLGSLFANFGGLLHTAQVAKGDVEAERLDSPEPRPWPNFESTWVPVAPDLKLFSRLGVHRDADGKPLRRDTVLIAVGFLGNLGGYRYRDLSAALYERGYHVLCMEMRGHGQTGQKYSDIPMTFGILESTDLLNASHWVRENCAAKRVGLIGFSWGATDALIAAWLDGEMNRSYSSDPIWRRVPFAGRTSAFDAGVIAMSPILDMNQITESFEQEYSVLGDPIRNYTQNNIKQYMKLRNAPFIDHRVKTFIKFEAGRCVLAREYRDYPTFEATGFDFLDIVSESGMEKLRRIRTPVLVIHGVNDPLSPAHLVAGLGNRVRNPNFGVLLMPGGGHGGLPAVSSAYYYSLILNFFNPLVGPRSVSRESSSVVIESRH